MTGNAPSTDKATLGLSIAFALLWNSGFIGAEFGLPYAGPFTLLFWRYVALSLVLLLYILARGRRLWPGVHAAARASLIGILAHGVWLGCVLLALDQDVAAGIVALGVALQPLTTGAFSGLITEERTDRYQWLGLAIGFCGVVIAVGARLNAEGAASVIAYVLPFGSVVAITGASLFQRRQEIRNHVLPLDTTLLYQSVATMVVVAAPAAFVEEFATVWSAPFLATMAWLIVAVSLGAYGAMWMLLARIDATRVASLFYFGPPVTMAMAWVAFGDGLLVTDVAGLLVAGLGVLLVQLRDRFRRPA